MVECLVCMLVCVCVCVCVSVCLSVSLSACLSVCLCVNGLIVYCSLFSCSEYTLNHQGNWSDCVFCMCVMYG